MSTQARPFERVLLDAVDESLLVLGDEPKATIYSLLESQHFIEKEEIPRRLGDFSLSIRKIFGAGGPVVERLILKKLCQQLDLEYQAFKQNDFQKAVEQCRKTSIARM
jgi:hypothetical protein